MNVEMWLLFGLADLLALFAVALGIRGYLRRLQAVRLVDDAISGWRSGNASEREKARLAHRARERRVEVEVEKVLSERSEECLVLSNGGNNVKSIKVLGGLAILFVACNPPTRPPARTPTPSEIATCHDVATRFEDKCKRWMCLADEQTTAGEMAKCHRECEFDALKIGRDCLPK